MFLLRGVLVPGFRENGWDYARSVVGFCEEEKQLGTVLCLIFEAERLSLICN